MIEDSLGLRASKISVTRGRPPTISAEPEASLGWRASIWPGLTDFIAVLDFDAGLGGEVVEVEGFMLVVASSTIMMRGWRLALVLGDDQLRCRRRTSVPLSWISGSLLAFGFGADGFADDDVFEADHAAGFLLGEDRGAVGVPLDDQLAAS